MNSKNAQNNNNKAKQNNDIYNLLENMETNIEKLFESLGIVMDKQSINTPNIITYIFQSMFTDKNVLESMVALNDNLKKAIKKNEEIRLDTWSTKELLKEANDERKILQKRIKELDKNIAGKEAEKIEQDRVLMKKELELQSIKDQYALDRNQHETSNLNFVNSMIAFRDSLIMKEGLCKDRNDESAAELHKLLAVMLKESANMMQKNEIEILDLLEQYDSSIQIVTDVVATEDIALHDTVAETFRPGYRFKNKLIRPQEVILYSDSTK